MIIKTFLKSLILFVVLFFGITLTINNSAFAAEPDVVTPDPAASEMSFQCSTPVCAAYSSQGLRTLAKMIDFFGIGSTDKYFVKWGGFIFALALMSALVMMALGQAPKNYGWFMLGPAMFYFLLGTTVNGFKAVQWKIGQNLQDQTYVYRLLNPAIGDVEGDGSVSGDEILATPNAGKPLPFYIVKLDSLVSETVGNLVNIFLPKDVSGSPSTGDNKWYLLSNSKWPLLQSLTAARLQSNDFRDMLAIFMASECGDKLGESIDPDKLALAGKVKDGGTLPDTIFKIDSSAIKETLKGTIGMPYAFVQAFKNLKPDSPLYKLVLSAETDKENAATQPQVSCANLLRFIMDGFLYESRQYYHNLPQSMSLQGKVYPAEVSYSFFNGWAIESDEAHVRGSKLIDLFGADSSSSEADAMMQNFIMSYMFRNEMMLLPIAGKKELLPGEKPAVFAERYHASIGGSNKYGEFYTWSLLMPHLQGLLLYALAIGYPIVCIMLLFPGHFKWVITWTTFYIWAKFWDVGFAIVGNIERSVWASVGNSPEIGRLNGKIFELNNYDYITTGLTRSDKPLVITRDAGYDNAKVIELFDKSLILAQSLSHDLQNSFYVYLMSALYFAVPAVTGQLILGAKAGAASLVTGAIQGVQGEGGSAAKAGVTGEAGNLAGLTSMGVNQGLMAKGLRAAVDEKGNNLVTKSLQTANRVQDRELEAAYRSQKAKQSDFRAQHLGARAQEQQARNNVDETLTQLGAAGVRATMMGLGGALLTPQGLKNLNDIVGPFLGSQNEMDNVVNRNLDDDIKREEIRRRKTPPAQSSAVASAGGSTAGAGGTAGGVMDFIHGAQERILGPREEGKGNRKWEEGSLSMISRSIGNLNNVYVRGNEIISNASATMKQLEAGIVARNSSIGAELAGYEASSLNKGETEAARRGMVYGNFAVQESAYRGMAAYSQQVSGLAASMGVSAGTFAPKNRPMEAEMLAAGGYISEDYNAAFDHFSDKGAYMFSANENLNSIAKQATNYQTFGHYKSDLEAGTADSQMYAINTEYSFNDPSMNTHIDDSFAPTRALRNLGGVLSNATNDKTDTFYGDKRAEASKVDMAELTASTSKLEGMATQGLNQLKGLVPGLETEVAPEPPE